MPSSGTVPAPAHCAAHPDREAAVVCSRCGAPACATCALPVEPPVCRACAERERKVELQPPSARASVKLAWRLFRRSFWKLLLVSLIFAAPSAIADRFSLSHQLGPIEQMQLTGALQLLLGTIGLVATARLLLQAALDQPLELSGALLYGLKRWPSAAAATFVLSLVVGVGMLLLVVPGILAALQFCLVLPLLAATRLDANQTLLLSKQLVEGHRLALFKALGSAVVISGLPSLAIELGVSASGLLDRPQAWWIAPLLLAGETALGLCQAFLVAAQVACYRQLLAYSGAYQGVTETTI